MSILNFIPLLIHTLAWVPCSECAIKIANESENIKELNRTASAKLFWLMFVFWFVLGALFSI